MASKLGRKKKELGNVISCDYHYMPTFDILSLALLNCQATVIWPA